LQLNIYLVGYYDMSDGDAAIAGEFARTCWVVGHDWASYLLGVVEKPDELHVVVHSVAAPLEQGLVDRSIELTCGDGGSLASAQAVKDLVAMW
jgi:hypothetical protein